MCDYSQFMVKVKERRAHMGVDTVAPTVLLIQTDQQPIERKEVNKMPVAKQRNVRYTGNFSFIVPADQPGKAAEVLETIRQHGTVSNVRSVNVKAEAEATSAE